MNLKLYSVFHQPFIFPGASFIQPIQAGKILAKEKLNMPGDDTGDHISHLNPFFCELTAMYWVWKNADRKENDYWGLCHYRRYFTQPVRRFIKKSKTLIRAKISQKEMDYYVNETTGDLITDTLKDHDVLLQTPMYLYRKKGVIKSIEQHYREFHISEHWDILKKRLLRMYPPCEKSFELFCDAKKISFFNMAVGNWKFWDAYFNWLFPLLFEVHSEIKLTGDRYQDRAIGFMAERLINLYIWHHPIKAAYLPVVVFDK